MEQEVWEVHPIHTNYEVSTEGKVRNIIDESLHYELEHEYVDPWNECPNNYQSYQE